MPRDPVALSDAQRDRAVGALLGTAAGDALAGAGEPRPPEQWTDPTAMAIAIAEFAATGVGLDEVIWQDRLVERWAWWARTATDVGQTGRTLDGSWLTHAGPDAGEACRLWEEAIRHAASTGRLDIRIGLC
jgi:ADP-ribosylglycohydrolase